MKPHDKLQSDCFMWCWNEKQDLRYLLFTTRNNLTFQEGDLKSKIKMGIMKAMGSVKGTTDLIFYYSGRLYGFDIKIGKDKLSKEQLEFISALRSQGGGGMEIRSLEQFQLEIDCILTNGCLTTEL
jgi:hypothetical protein